MRLDDLPHSDLQLLLDAVGEDPADAAALRARPDRIEALAADPRVAQRLRGDPEADPLLRASPALVFLVLLQRTLSELSRTPFVEEDIGPRERVPLFDTATLRDFAAARARRLFLVELLASYTRVESGTMWLRTDQGWRRRRFSELDPVHLAHLLETASDAERPALCRRIGDLCLFLCGVVPQYVQAHPLEPRDIVRIRRTFDTIGEPIHGPGELVLAAGGQGPRWLMEWLGAQAYRVAARLTGPCPASDLLGEVADRLAQARRILDLLTRRHLGPLAGRWFAVGG
jgi:hypothetical protein